jgi:hypothetical protein
LALQIADHVSVAHGATLFVSLEMSAVEVGQRYLRNELGLESSHSARALFVFDNATAAQKLMAVAPDVTLEVLRRGIPSGSESGSWGTPTRLRAPDLGVRRLQSSRIAYAQPLRPPGYWTRTLDPQGTSRTLQRAP